MTYSIYTESLAGQPLTVYSGLASGVDTQSIVQAQTAAASQKQQILNTDANSNASLALLYGNIATQLGALQADTGGLADAGLFAPSTGNSSNSAAVAVAVASTAQTGTHAVNVTQLAQAQINNSDDFSSASSTLISGAGSPSGPTSGTVQLQVGSGAAQSFAVDTTTTLTQIAAAINSSSLAPQLTATVVNDANGYHLNLVGANTGSANAITITETNTSLNLTAHQVQTAQNATGTVDGTAFSDATNTDSAAVAGVTMSFVQLTASPVTVTVSKDPSNLASQVQTFVTNYNASLQQINAATTYGTSTNLGNLLADSGVQNLTGELSQAITAAPASATGTYHTLAEAGISLNSDGTLSINAAALTAAIGEDASSVANLLSNTSSGTGIAQTIDAIASSFGGPTGTLALMAQAQAGIGAQNLQTAANMQYSIDAQQQTLQTNFVNYERQMSNLAEQNLVVQAFANSATGVVSPVVANGPAPDAGAPASSSSSSATTTAPEANPYSADVASTTSGLSGRNGYVPAYSNV